MKRRLIIFDTTLREGEQAPGCMMLVPEKVELAKMLEKLNVDVIEAGFAVASPGDFAAIQAVARTVHFPAVSSLCRALQPDIDAALEALKAARRPRIHIVLALSDLHLKYKLNMTPQQAIDTAVRAVSYAHSRCDDVQFTAEDAGRADRGFLIKALDAIIAAGASTVNITDTVGYQMPEEFGGLIRFLREKLSQASRVQLSVHVHNDLGMALASSLAAVEAGVNQVECTLNGLGDRAGICAMEELAAVLKNRQDYFSDVWTDLRGEHFHEACRLAARVTGMRIPHHKPVIGAGVRKKNLTAAVFA